MTVTFLLMSAGLIMVSVSCRSGGAAPEKAQVTVGGTTLATGVGARAGAGAIELTSDPIEPPKHAGPVEPPAALREIDSLICSPPAAAGARLSLEAVRALAGKYALRLVEEPSQHCPHNTTTGGTLWLWRTSRHDRSPSGERPAPGDVSEYPLYGAIDLDFAAVHAPVDLGRWSKGVRRGEVDPVSPPVLVIIQKYREKHGRPLVLVGTVAERLPDVWTVDGTGIGLSIEQVDGSGFSGRWSEWGIAVSGRGYFCARRIRS